ncbi:hypothetical protein [Streptomyces collinus]|nr:hypothetical protein [Streptomyces collinus]UJA06308.1 MerR family transcriptional regulator [Streptomyces collinus]UJA12522.1 MerR family transcriptional regulator [Streptomyces collinus]
MRGGPSAIAMGRLVRDHVVARDRIDGIIADLRRSWETLDEVNRTARDA